MAALPTDALGDLFLLYSNAARRRKVVLSASDTMYAVRLSTARTSDALRAFSPAAAAAGACAVTAGAGLDSINRAGFEKMLRDCPGLLDGVSVDVNYVFMENLGASGLGVGRVNGRRRRGVPEGHEEIGRRWIRSLYLSKSLTPPFFYYLCRRSNSSPTALRALI